MSKRRDALIRRKVKRAMDDKSVEVGRQYFNWMCDCRLRRRAGLALRILFKRKLPGAAAS